jgi:hypothetical protein
MDCRRWVVLGFCALALVGVGLYCPWSVVEPIMPGGPVRSPGGAVIGGAGPEFQGRTVYRWAWDPPRATLEPATVRVNWPLLILEIGAVVVIGVVAGRWIKATAPRPGSGSGG